MVRYITPAGSGSRDGTSWANAGTLGSLDSFIGAVGPGGEVLLRADMGGYNIGGIDTRTIGHGGASGAPVTVRGADEFGAGMKVEFVGVRADPWLPGLNKGGQEVFLLQSGADHLVFRDLSFKNVGSAAFRIGADISRSHASRHRRRQRSAVPRRPGRRQRRHGVRRRTRR